MRINIKADAFKNIEREVDKAVGEIAEFLKEEWKLKIYQYDVIASKDYLNSIEIAKPAECQRVVFSSDNETKVCAIEFGTGPKGEGGGDRYVPPIEPLIEWVKLKFGLEGKDAEKVAWFIRAKIEDEGTDPKPCAREAINSTKAKLNQIMKKS